MKSTKALALLGTFLAAGAIGAALTLAYASEASELRARLRGLYDDLAARMRRGGTEPRPAEPPTAARHAHGDHVAMVRAEHVLEHGADGRARARDQSKKPHVRP